MSFEIRDQFATVNHTVFQPGDVVLDAFGPSATGLAGTVVAFLPILPPTNAPAVNVDWVDGTNSDILTVRLRRM